MRTISSLVLILTFCGCQTCISGYDNQTMKDKTEAGWFSATNGISFPYRHYVSTYSTRSKLIFMMHGAGERGNDNERQLNYGINHLAKFAEEHSFPITVIAPQCPTDHFWKDEEMLVALGEFINKMRQLPYVHSNEVCMTGFSMGGDCSWHCMLKYPKVVRKIAPICGGPLAGSEDYAYLNVPSDAISNKVWAVNYLDDNVVDNTCSKFVTGTLWSNNRKGDIHYTEFFSGGHTAEIYEDPIFLYWIIFN